ncbi:TPM domain-containing protein [Sulfuricystis thermophila]|uniref:TPM domain-containing protein n=1 Tax=Sulfuricystis thermophila TaxID=2496847 RepID=UPI001035D319|nr:TPM domain-containing protein [Sulfuricystis thermophila]
MRFKRLCKHLLTPPWLALRRFPTDVRREIALAVAESERHHRGELRVAIEGPLPVAALLRDVSPRERALELFASLRVWDTQENSGVLIYLQLVDRDVEILVDRGIAAKVPPEQWQRLCRDLETAMREGRCREGLLAAIAAITALLAEHFPARSENPNELPNEPVML